MYQGLAKNTCNVSVMGSIPIVSTTQLVFQLVVDSSEQTGILVCQSSWSGRLPVTQEITGSSPVRTATMAGGIGWYQGQSHKLHECGSIPQRRNKAGLTLRSWEVSFWSRNWDAEVRVLKVCTDKVWVLPAKRVYCL